MFCNIQDDDEDDGTSILSGRRKIKRQRPSSNKKRGRSLLEIDGYSSSDSVGTKKRSLLPGAGPTPPSILANNSGIQSHSNSPPQN